MKADKNISSISRVTSCCKSESFSLTC